MTWNIKDSFPSKFDVWARSFPKIQKKKTNFYPSDLFRLILIPGRPFLRFLHIEPYGAIPYGLFWEKHDNHKEFYYKEFF